MDDAVVAAMHRRPVAGRVGDRHQRFLLGHERDGALGGEAVDAGVHEVPARLVDLFGRALPEQGRVVEVAHQRHPLAGHLAGFARVDLGLEVEDVPAGRGEEVDPVDGLAAAVEDARPAHLLRDVLVHLEQEVAVGLGATQVAGRVVGPHDGVGTGLELRPRGGDAGRHERVEVALDLVGIEHDVHQEVSRCRPSGSRPTTARRPCRRWRRPGSAGGAA